MKLILIRHGKTEANEKHLYCGKTDLPLSSAGREELKVRKTVVRYPDPAGMSILTSGMKRCEETLAILWGNVPHSTDFRFREMDLGKFEMHSYEELKEDSEYLAWITGDNESNVTPGGESGKMMTERVLEGLNDLLASGQDALLITHGGVIAAIMSHLFPNEGKNRYEWQPAPGDGYVMDLPGQTYESLQKETSQDSQKL